MNTYPLDVEAAQRIILDSVPAPRPCTVPLHEAYGYVLAEDLTADMDVPLYDRSMMDGFAVCWEDTQAASPQAPARLRVVAEIPAGSVPQRTIGPGEAARIMTGAMIPAGADAVCRFEATRAGTARDIAEVEILAPVRPGDNIARKGEDIPRGHTVLRRGDRLGPAEIAVLAAFGRAQVPVFRKPVVAILSSGSELADLNEELAPGKIRNSNSPMAAALIAREGGIPRVLKPAADDEAAICAAIAEVWDEVDLVVTTGGVSVGDYDLMPQVYECLGAETVFWRVLLRPGSPFRFARKGGTPLFGLSGNPAACFVNTQLFVLPGLRRMSGFSRTVVPYAKAKLVNVAPKNIIKQARFLRATAFLQNGSLHVEMAAGQSSGMIGSLVGANCLIRLPGGKAPAEGTDVEILLYDEVALR